MTAAILITVVGSVLAYGNENNDARASFLTLKEGIYRVMYVAEGESLVKIKITDSKGHVLVNERVKSKGGFMRPYNFEDAKNDIYTIALSDKYGEITEEIHIGKKTVCNCKSTN